MGGHGVGDAGEGRGDPRHPPRQGREVRVQVGDGVPARLARQLHSLGHHVTGQLGQDRHDGGEALAVLLASQALGELTPQVDGPVRSAHPVDAGGDPGDLGVEARIRGGAQCIDAQVLALGLAGQDLGDDEGLREARVDLEDVSDAGTVVANVLVVVGCGIHAGISILVRPVV